MADPEYAGPDYSLGAGTIPIEEFSPEFLGREQKRYPRLVVIQVPSVLPMGEPVCWVKHGRYVFFGSFDSLGENSLRTYQMAQ